MKKKIIKKKNYYNCVNKFAMEKKLQRDLLIN